MSKKVSYEDHIEELETIISEIEDERISVDDLSAKVKRAAELIRKCQALLKNTGEEVDAVLKGMKD